MVQQARVCFRGTHVFIGSHQGALVCSLVIDDALQYLSPQLALTEMSVRLEAIEVASRIMSFQRGTAREVHCGFAFDESAQKKMRPCDSLKGDLLIAFTLKLAENLPYAAPTPRTSVGRGHHSPLELWDGIQPNRD